MSEIDLPGRTHQDLAVAVSGRFLLIFIAVLTEKKV